MLYPNLTVFSKLLLALSITTLLKPVSVAISLFSSAYNMPSTELKVFTSPAPVQDSLALVCAEPDREICLEKAGPPPTPLPPH